MTGSEALFGIFPGLESAAPGALFEAPQPEPRARKKYTTYKRLIALEAEIVGKKFGPITVLGRIDTVSRARWRCRCDCGAEITLRIEYIERRFGCSKTCPVRRELCREIEKTRTAGTP